MTFSYNIIVLFKTVLLVGLANSYWRNILTFCSAQRRNSGPIKSPSLQVKNTWWPQLAQIFCVYVHVELTPPPSAGASIPSEAMMHYPLFQISPYFLKKIALRGKIFPTWPFTKNFLDFNAPKFLMTFFSHWPQIHKCLILPYFRYFTTFPPFPGKCYFPPTLQIPSWFRKIYVFLHTFLFFVFPPSLTMHHTQWRF